MEYNSDSNQSCKSEALLYFEKITNNSFENLEEMNSDLNDNFSSKSPFMIQPDVDQKLNCSQSEFSIYDVGNPQTSFNFAGQTYKENDFYDGLYFYIDI